MKLKPKQKKLATLIVVSLLLGYIMTQVSSAREIKNNPADVWHKVVTQAEPVFEVMMPGVPRHTINEVSFAAFNLTLKTASIISEDHLGREHVVNITALSEKIKSLSSEAIFKEAIKLLTPENAILLSFNAKENPANFQIVRTDQGRSMQGRFLIQDSHLILQSVAYQGDSLTAADYERFIASLSFK